MATWCPLARSQVSLRSRSAAGSSCKPHPGPWDAVIESRHRWWCAEVTTHHHLQPRDLRGRIERVEPPNVDLQRPLVRVERVVATQGPMPRDAHERALVLRDHVRDARVGACSVCKLQTRGPRGQRDVPSVRGETDELPATCSDLAGRDRPLRNQEGRKLRGSRRVTRQSALGQVTRTVSGAVVARSNG
jgi:hypothetical protein